MPFADLPNAVAVTFKQLIPTIIYVNIMLFVFNLLPIPPLDGGYILEIFIGDKFPEVIEWLSRYGILVLLLIFMLPQTFPFYIALIELVWRYLVLLVI